jgi:hypothetical protein
MVAIRWRLRERRGVFRRTADDPQLLRVPISPR